VRRLKIWWVWALVCSVGAAHAITLIDDRGTRVTLAAPAQRIVSLLPSLTETVCALGACDRLVGVDRYSNFPESMRRLPQLGGGLDPNIESIVALKPDLVLLAGSTRGGDRLRALGLTVLTLEPNTHTDVRRALEQVALALGVADAQRVWRGIEADLQAAAGSLPARLAATRVYFEVNRAPYAASESSFIGETLARLGLRNVVPGSLGPFPLLNPEYVVRADPDVIMVGDVNFVGMADRPGWRSLRAIAGQRVCVFTPAQSDVLVRPGPRMAQGAHLMADCLRKVLP